MQKVFFSCLFVLVSLLSGTANAQTSVRSSTYPLIALWSFWEIAHLPTPQAPEAAEAGAELPAEVPISLSAERAGSGALLKWDLAQPEEVTSLVIEASEDGHVFTDLEALEEAEAGTVDVFYDAEPQERRYYRIVANYKDGRQRITSAGCIPSTEPVFSAAFESDESNLLTIHSDGPVALYDLQGQLLTTATPTEGTYLLDMGSLPQGQAYLVRSGENRKVVFYGTPALEAAAPSDALPALK